MRMVRSWRREAFRSTRSQRLALLLVFLALTPGCHRVPLRFHEGIPTPEETSIGIPEPASQSRTTANLGATVADSATELTVPTLDSHSSSSRKSSTGSSRFVSANSPTPHLDAALARANLSTVETKETTPLRESGARSVASMPPGASAELVVLGSGDAGEQKPESEPSNASVVLPPLASAPAETSPLDLTQVSPKPAKPDPQVQPASIPPSPNSELDPGRAAETKTTQASPSTDEGHAVQPPPTTPVKPPVETWPERLSALIAMAKSSAAKTDDDASTWEMRRRILQALEVDAIGSAEAELWGTALDLVKVSRSEPPDEHAVASEIEAAVDTLESLAPFQVSTIELCRRVSGFGTYDVADSRRLKSGQAVIVYCELRGLTYERIEGEYRSRVGAKLALVPRGKDEPTWTKTLDPAEDACRKRRRDYYVNYKVSLPSTLDPGSYELRIISTDLRSGREATGVLPVELTR